MWGSLSSKVVFATLLFRAFFQWKFSKEKEKVERKKKTVMITQVILAFRKGTKSFENIKH